LPGRILTLQRQVRELGRLRAGWSEPVPGKRPRPVKSKTWLVTSPSKEYIDAAAEAWGGTVERWKPQGAGAEQWRVITEASAIDALLPPGDPVSQAYEMWSGGGCQRRCDGVTEQLSKRDCLCRAQFGEDEFYKQPPDKACRPTTRLGLIIPELPDLGIWRMESHGFYAANEITAMVDLIKSRVDSDLVIPVTLRIEQRSRVAQGKTKQFTVVTVGLRGATAQQILAGAVPALALDGAPERPALESAPAGPTVETARTAEQFKTLARLARDPETIRMLWDRSGTVGVLDDSLKSFLTARAVDLGAEMKPNGNGKPATSEAVKPASAPPAEPVEGELEPDQALLWPAILAEAGARKWSADDLEKRVIARFDLDSSAIDGWQMQTFLNELTSGAVT